MRTLCLLDKNPLPPTSGSRQRLFHLLRALESLGPIDLLFECSLTRDEVAALEATFAGARVWTPPGPLPRFAIGRLRWFTARRLPLRLALIDRRPVWLDAERFVNASGERYDAAWSFTSTPSWLLARLTRRFPLVIDFADVREVLLDRALDAARRAPDRTTVAGVKRLVRLWIERGRWRRFDRAEGSRASLVTVCSAGDREALGVPGAVVVPNGYERPAAPLGRLEVGAAPCLLLVGQMEYGPNVEGAAWCAREVLPLLRRRLPDARLVIVGRAAPEVDALASLDGVEVRGYVEHLEDELAGADVVVVPLRQGSGTRIKILEAWAHRLPVVSTRIGAEGLDVVDRREVLLADDATSFADAVHAALTDPALRASLVAHGAERYDASFDWRAIEAAFAARVRALVESATRFDEVPTP